MLNQLISGPITVLHWLELGLGLGLGLGVRLGVKG